jgi:hypothetical protein
LLLARVPSCQLHGGLLTFEPWPLPACGQPLSFPSFGRGRRAGWGCSAAMGQPHIRLFRVVETHTFWDHHGGTTAPVLRQPRHKYARRTTRRGIKSFRPRRAFRRAAAPFCTHPRRSAVPWTLTCSFPAAFVAPARLQAVGGVRLVPWRRPSWQSAPPPVAAWALKFDILGSLMSPLHSHSKQTNLTFLFEERFSPAPETRGWRRPRQRRKRKVWVVGRLPRAAAGSAPTMRIGSAAAGAGARESERPAGGCTDSDGSFDVPPVRPAFQISPSAQ